MQADKMLYSIKKKSFTYNDKYKKLIPKDY